MWLLWPWQFPFFHHQNVTFEPFGQLKKLNLLKTKMKGHESLRDNYIPRVSWKPADTPKEMPKFTHLLRGRQAIACSYTSRLAAPRQSITSHLQADQPNHAEPKPKPFDPGEVRVSCAIQGRRKKGAAVDSLGYSGDEGRVPRGNVVSVLWLNTE